MLGWWEVHADITNSSFSPWCTQSYKLYTKHCCQITFVVRANNSPSHSTLATKCSEAQLFCLQQIWYHNCKHHTSIALSNTSDTVPAAVSKYASITMISIMVFAVKFPVPGPPSLYVKGRFSTFLKRDVRKIVFLRDAKVWAPGRVASLCTPIPKTELRCGLWRSAVLQKSRYKPAQRWSLHMIAKAQAPVKTKGPSMTLPGTSLHMQQCKGLGRKHPCEGRRPELAFIRDNSAHPAMYKNQDDVPDRVAGPSKPSSKTKLRSIP